MNSITFSRELMDEVARIQGVPRSHVTLMTRLGLDHQQIETAVAQLAGKQVGGFNQTSTVNDVVKRYKTHFGWLL